MKLLIFSDLHLLNYKNPAQQTHLNKLFNESISTISPDISFFCGDILDKGKGSYSTILKDYLDSTGLDLSQIIIACGNHDINEANISTMFIGHINNFKDNKALDSFVEKTDDIDYQSSLNHISFFNDFISTTIDQCEISDLFYCIGISISS